MFQIATDIGKFGVSKRLGVYFGRIRSGVLTDLFQVVVSRTVHYASEALSFESRREELQ